jgi:hypothetical protein
MDDTLCGRCRYRHESIARTDAWRERTGSTGPAPLIADPAPKSQCKQHHGYGVPDETRAECSDFEVANG